MKYTVQSIKLSVKMRKRSRSNAEKKEAAVEATLQVVHVVAFLKSYGVTPSVVVVVVVLVQVAFPASSLRSTTTVTVLVIVKVDAETSKKKHGRLLVTLLWREQRGLSMSSSFDVRSRWSLGFKPLEMPPPPDGFYFSYSSTLLGCPRIENHVL